MKNALVFGLFFWFSSFVKANQLTIYAYPSPLGLDWTSPSSLTWTTITNSIYQDNKLINIHSIGHMNFDLSCDGGTRILTGQTSADDVEITRIMDEGYGLNVALTPSLGRWETSAEIEADLPIRFSRGSIAFIQFGISTPTCARVAEYLREYQEKNYDQIYGGLQSRPRHGEGAGCSAFAESVLEIAGLMAPEWKTSWQRFVRMQNSLLGGPAAGRNVTLAELLFGFDSYTWATSSDDSYALTFWDPDQVFNWIKTAAKKNIPLTGMTYQPTQNQKAYGIVINAQNIPTPTENFFYQPNE
jgi:hypothetical protein